MRSFFVIPGVLELWRKNLGGGGRIPPPGPDRVNPIQAGGGSTMCPPTGFFLAVLKQLAVG